MNRIMIEGAKRLEGKVLLQGAKNSVLPILAAAVIINGESVIHNCPDLTDVNAAIDILRYLGCEVTREGHTIIINSRNISKYDVPPSLMHEMRSSVLFLGSILARTGKAKLSSPGGCEIGLRPIDLHISAMQSLGVEVSRENGEILFSRGSERLVGSKITLTVPSVGATENIIIAASTAKGTTTIVNSAREPEIVDLANYLNSCGAKISGAGNGIIVIEGVDSLAGCEHRVIADRIIASTYMAAAAITGGEVVIEDVITEHLAPVISVFEQSGCKLEAKANQLKICAHKRLNAINPVKTMPYPGFPTDSQAIIMAMTCVAKGTSLMIETIFESRFKHVGELTKLGANIYMDGRTSVVEGVEKLNGACVDSLDLRGGTALVVAGLGAEGTTYVNNIHHIDRGFEKIEDSFSQLGANIKRERII